MSNFTARLHFNNLLAVCCPRGRVKGIPTVDAISLFIQIRMLSPLSIEWSSKLGIDTFPLAFKFLWSSVDLAVNIMKRSSKMPLRLKAILSADRFLNQCQLSSQGYARIQHWSDRRESILFSSRRNQTETSSFWNFMRKSFLVNDSCLTWWHTK